MLSEIDKPIVVVAHDAGAVNHIIAWLKKFGHEEVYPYVRGPAMKAWSDAFPIASIRSDLNSDILQSCVMITGTGWASSFEHDARVMASKLGIRSIAVVDHWTNYRERFIFNSCEQLPDEIWVTDKYAFNLALELFGSLKIVLMPNSYLEQQLVEISASESKQEKGVTNLLYVLEPIRNSWGPDLHNGEFMGLDFFKENLHHIESLEKLKIKLRPHPSDALGKYDMWISNQKNIDITLDDSTSLAAAIAWSHIVVGCQTYAMVVALAAGKRVYSSVPKWAPECVLPQSEITRISEMNS